MGRKTEIKEIERLKLIKGRPWVYRNQVVEILGFADGVGEDADEVEIYLNSGTTIECRITELGKKLNEFSPANGTVVTYAQHKLDKVSSMQPNVMEELRNTILQSIRDVREDPGKINQAKQIFQGVNTMINLAKTELEFRKYMDSSVAGNKR